MVSLEVVLVMSNEGRHVDVIFGAMFVVVLTTCPGRSWRMDPVHDVERRTSASAVETDGASPSRLTGENIPKGFRERSSGGGEEDEI